MAFFHKKCLILCQCIFVMFAERLENKKTCAFFNWRNALRKRSLLAGPSNIRERWQSLCLGVEIVQASKVASARTPRQSHVSVHQTCQTSARSGVSSCFTFEVLKRQLKIFLHEVLILYQLRKRQCAVSIYDRECRNI